MTTCFVRFYKLSVFLLVLLAADPMLSYPVDGYKKTKIKRLAWLSLVLSDSLRGTKPPEGGRKSIMDIKLNLRGERGAGLDSLPAVDPELQRQINALFPGRDRSYAVALLDITPGSPIRFAEKRSDQTLSPGSVGKLCIAAGLFTELQHIFPNDSSARIELLKNRMVRGGLWAKGGSHAVPVFDVAAQKGRYRKIQEDDVFTLYEWLDHMLSASSNSAANVVWKEALLMRHFDKAYPPTPEQEKEYLEKTSRSELAEIAHHVVNGPLRDLGISDEEWRLGSFFSSYGKRTIPVTGGSSASPLAFLRLLVSIERGLLVDHWSSLEIKRLMYMTARRIRFASSPAIEDAAVYYKSGSLYSCKEEAGFNCGKYRGNRINVLNSVAIVEHSEGATYLVALMSNVLRKNSSVEHQSLATFIDRILKVEEKTEE